MSNFITRKELESGKSRKETKKDNLDENTYINACKNVEKINEILVEARIGTLTPKQTTKKVDDFLQKLKGKKDGVLEYSYTILLIENLIKKHKK